MGQALSAELFYGYDLGDLTDPTTYDSLEPTWMQEDLDWEEELATRLGWTSVPFPSYPPEVDDYRTSSEERRAARDALRATPEYQSWSSSRDELSRLVKGLGVSLATYGYHEEPGHFIKVTESRQSVCDYGSIQVKVPLEVQPDWDEKLARFMELLELLALEGEKPAWHLNCSYG